MEDDVCSAVRGKWYEVLSSLGIPKEFLQKKSGPCPLCGGKDRYTWTNFNDDGVYICRHCGNGNGWTLLQKYNGWSFVQAVQEVEPLVGILNIQKDTDDKLDPALKYNPKPALVRVAKASTKLTWGSTQMDYLRSRGFDDVPEGLRKADLPYWENGKKIGIFPTVVALIQDFEGKGVSYHLTYTKDGKKADVKHSRKVMKPIGTITGAAIRLHPEFEDKICISEGLESSYAAYKDCGLPAFSALNAGNLTKFVPPKGIKTIFIYGDNDLNFVGQVAAYTLAERLTGEGYEAYVFIPDKIGTDWADTLSGVDYGE
jgi:putative DNA primase/helicase